MTAALSSTADSVCIGCGQARPVTRMARFQTRLTQLLRLGGKKAAGRPVALAMSAEEVLGALSPTASPALREAIAAGCCIVYTVAEGNCSPSCGSGWCCYHAVSSGCKIDLYECVNVPCSRGTFTTGC